MAPRPSIQALTSVLLVLLLGSGCGERDLSTLDPVPPNTDPLVFDDTFGDAVDFQAFLGSRVDALSIDRTQRFQGNASLKVTVPSPGDPAGGYAGGAFTTGVTRDLSGYNALTFWAKGSMSATLDIVGLGNDNTGTSLHEASWSGVPLTTTWTRYVVPVPQRGKLTDEGGLFYFAEGPENGTGYEVWFDEVRFENVTSITDPRPLLTSATTQAFVGAGLPISGTQTTFSVAGTDQVIQHSPRYFDFASSNDSVAVVEDGIIRPLAGGTAVITARLGEVEAAGSLTVQVTEPPSEPAPTPSEPGADVISLFSDAYPNVTVDTWSTTWDRADVLDLVIGGQNAKVYTNLIFAGIEFVTEPIDATEMTHFHMDVWVPSGTIFRIKLVDFGEDGIFGGAPDSEHELTFNASSTPPVTPGSWIQFDIPLDDFTRLTSRGHIAQLVISGNVGTAYVDNIYFHK